MLLILPTCAKNTGGIDAMEKLALVAGLAVLGGIGNGAQEPNKIETELTLEFASKYVWHGLNSVNDNVFQPGVSFSMKGFTLSFWGSAELTNWNEPNYDLAPKGRFSEIDTSIQYDGACKNMGWNVGIVDYQYPGTGYERYREWFAGVSFEDAPGAPSLTLYAGDNKTSGTYATLGLSHSIPVNMGKAESFDLALEMTYGDARSNRFLYGYDGATLTDIHLSASTQFDLGRGWSFTPTLHYSTLLHPDILRDEPRRSNFWAGFAFGVKF